ncbi:hypothetical protein OUZ56_009425 [Daphnia magna]|uniref:Uncharacterized protein n=1 Tax=Daphnia magna TaxID=35525 RepID=A0ABR0AFZ1_9CRUS|nr:hypothetical protein OUZ56_009425 [Daphnia magna]
MWKSMDFSVTPTALDTLNQCHITPSAYKAPLKPSHLQLNTWPHDLSLEFGFVSYFFSIFCPFLHLDCLSGLDQFDTTARSITRLWICSPELLRAFSIGKRNHRATRLPLVGGFVQCGGGGQGKTEIT